MKQVIYGMLCGMMVIFIAILMMTLQGRGTRESEVKHALAEAMEHALDQVMEEDVPAVTDSDRFVADFLCELIAEIDSNAEIEVNILKADYEKGLMDVEVVETFVHPSGEKGKIAVRRTIIFDRKAETV